MNFPVTKWRWQRLCLYTTATRAERKKERRMKLQKFSSTAVAILAGLSMVIATGSAQDTNSTRRAERRGPNVKQRVERLSEELKLNDEQNAKMTTLLETQAKQRRELMADNNLSRDERREKMRAIMQDERKEVKALLTPEQF